MIGHHLQLAARNIPRAGPFVLISIVGLALGLGAALLIGPLRLRRAQLRALAAE
jgi:hypothetical protein